MWLCSVLCACYETIWRGGEAKRLCMLACVCVYLKIFNSHGPKLSKWGIWQLMGIKIHHLFIYMNVLLLCYFPYYLTREDIQGRVDGMSADWESMSEEKCCCFWSINCCLCCKIGQWLILLQGSKPTHTLLALMCRFILKIIGQAVTVCILLARVLWNWHINLLPAVLQVQRVTWA